MGEGQVVFELPAGKGRIIYMGYDYISLAARWIDVLLLAQRELQVSHSHSFDTQLALLAHRGLSPYLSLPLFVPPSLPLSQPSPLSSISHPLLSRSQLHDPRTLTFALSPSHPFTLSLSLSFARSTTLSLSVIRAGHLQPLGHSSVCLGVSVLGGGVSGVGRERGDRTDRYFCQATPPPPSSPSRRQVNRPPRPPLPLVN